MKRLKVEALLIFLPMTFVWYGTRITMSPSFPISDADPPGPRESTDNS
ncbi:hypothetical protein BVI2075_280010 [Burkholderia vietnamiensis]|nr:hypothetical protein BVI2075_280010 [Burkholderia vietnamiensis]